MCYTSIIGRLSKGRLLGAAPFLLPGKPMADTLAPLAYCPNCGESTPHFLEFYDYGRVGTCAKCQREITWYRKEPYALPEDVRSLRRIRENYGF